MKEYKNHTIKDYLDVLAKKTPAPGGGSAAALTAALGAALLSMVAHYSLGKTSSRQNEQRIKATLKHSEQLRKRFLMLVDLDAQAYLNLVKTRKASPAKRNAAKRKAAAVPLEICKLCYKAVQLSPTLVRYGNKYLILDVKVALELLLAAFNAAKLNVEINQ